MALELPENIDIHLFRNRKGKWCVRIDTAALIIGISSAHSYTTPCETPMEALAMLGVWFKQPTDFSKKEQT